MGQLDGYVGIPLDEGQLGEDIIFLILLLLLITFAFVFRSNKELFRKMFKDIRQTKDRPNLFENVSGNEFFFNHFMTFQTLLLTSLSLLSIGRLQGYISFSNPYKTAFHLLILFISLSLVTLFRKGVYELIGFVFANKERFNIWRTSYLATYRSWGVVLYIPTCWLLFTEINFVIPVILFIISYFLCRFVILYKSARIFLNKNHGIFYISLYLCSQEILPLLLLWKGLFYLYNFIEASTLWH